MAEGRCLGRRVQRLRGRPHDLLGCGRFVRKRQGDASRSGRQDRGELRRMGQRVHAPGSDPRMKVLVVDIGGTNVKLFAEGRTAPARFASGSSMTPDQMVAGVKALASGWAFDVMAIGYPGPVLHDRPVSEPHNLATGWVG